MSNFDKSYSYESLLDSLRATYSIRKKKFEEQKHLLSDEDRAIEQSLFRLEEDALTHPPYDRDALFNFDEFIQGISGAVPTSSDAAAFKGCPAAERRHVCPRPGCNKSYTSSHGLKYHLNHGHSKEKENIYKPFICPFDVCGKSYRNSNGLKYHMAKAHDVDK